MLRSAKRLHGYSIHATDGNLGHVDQFYFDDETWAIRYLVVNTGNWLLGRQVLISPMALGQTDASTNTLRVNLTMEQVKNSPDIDTHKPVSRRQEIESSLYYGWPLYWSGGDLWGSWAYPTHLAAQGGMILPAPPPVDTDAAHNMDTAESEDSHLRSTQEVIGYALEASDGEIGSVDDFILDDESWAMRYAVADTGNWWPGKKVLIDPRWIHKVSWAESTVHVGLLREAIRHSPEYDPSMPISREYEARLYGHYGRSRYWKEESLMQKCSEVMTVNVACCLRGDTVDQAAQLMKAEDVGPIPVVEDQGTKKLVGIVTDRDIAIKIVAEGRDARNTRVEDVMTRGVVTCRPDDDLQKALDAMSRHQVRRIPIVDDNGSIVGIIAQADVATRTEEPGETEDVLEDISQPG